jgi:hypothetical protein
MSPAMKIHKPKQAKARLRSVVPPRAGKTTSTKLYYKSRKSKASSWKIYKSSNGNYKASVLADQVNPPSQKQSPGISYKSSEVAEELQALDRSTSPAMKIHKPQAQASKSPGRKISPSPATNTSKAEIGGGPQGWKGKKLGASSPGFIWFLASSHIHTTINL